MTNHLFIAGDWGTSNFRLYLCEYQKSGSSKILETCSGPGVSQVQGNFEDVLFNLADSWITEHGSLPIILSGMVGSTIGWHEAPYSACPLNVSNVAEGRITFAARGHEISILAGLKTTNPLSTTDVMRGEELQLLGWLHANKASDNTSRLFTLPGTHNKWALIKDGRIETFVTALSGELFSLLKNHSVLIANADEKHIDEATYLRGVQAVEKLNGAHLLHALFATRSQQVTGELPPAQAQSYLSGLIIGSDVIGATTLFRSIVPDIAAVTLIGDPTLCHYYDLALKHLGLKTDISDPAQIAIAGYASIYQHFYL